MKKTGATADVYVVKLDTPGNVPFTNKTYVDILIEANDIYTLVNAVAQRQQTQHQLIRISGQQLMYFLTAKN